MDEPLGIIGYGRVAHPHRFPVSRDWDEVACKAVGCKWNRKELCMVPSRCKIGPSGQCEGFEASSKDELNNKIDGD